ncbi:MAG TPA: serine/threonine-protein kinase [Kofleriaceae bacterium]|nr:serine/threonine-protein kinase [Kofleriaceae bacterium]
MPSEVDRTMPLAITELAGPLVAGRYRLRGLLGRGGAGEVYEAEDTRTGAALAIKKLVQGPGDPERRAERFRREAQATGLLRHPNIVEVLDLIADHDALYLVMELVRGRPVGALIERGELTARRSLVIARQVLEALAHAHAHGMIHRDIKPDNLMLVSAGAPGREHERVKLLDFGLVKWIGDPAGAPGDQRLTQTGAVFGTPAYMAPEQALNRPLDERADLYALGVVVFEMLTGRPPFRSPDPMTLLRMHASAPPPALSAIAIGQPWCTPALGELVARALAKQPAARFASAIEMMAALDAAFLSLDHLPADP